MRTVVVVFNRDLRVHDHPALSAASREADRVAPLSVFDDGILRGPFAAPNRCVPDRCVSGTWRNSAPSRGAPSTDHGGSPRIGGADSATPTR